MGEFTPAQSAKLLKKIVNGSLPIKLGRIFGINAKPVTRIHITKNDRVTDDFQSAATMRAIRDALFRRGKINRSPHVTPI